MISTHTRRIQDRCFTHTERYDYCETYAHSTYIYLYACVDAFVDVCADVIRYRNAKDSIVQLALSSDSLKNLGIIKLCSSGTVAVRDCPTILDVDCEVGQWGVKARPTTDELTVSVNVAAGV